MFIKYDDNQTFTNNGEIDYTHFRINENTISQYAIANIEGTIGNKSSSDGVTNTTSDESTTFTKGNKLSYSIPITVETIY